MAHQQQLSKELVERARPVLWLTAHIKCLNTLFYNRRLYEKRNTLKVRRS